MGSPLEDTVAIVEKLAASGESYYVEFKTTWDYGPDGRTPRDVREIASDIGKTIVAFANADGGDLLVGVEDDGNITGIQHKDAHINYLKSWRQQVNIDQEIEPSVRVADVMTAGRRVLMFRVEALAGPPLVTSDGRCLMRKKKSSVPVSPQEVERRRTHVIGDQGYEAEPLPGARLEDLDWTLIRGTPLPRGGNHSHFNDFDDVALLRYWNLIEQRNGSIILRRAALLLFAKEPLRWHANNRLRIRRVFGDEPGYGRHLGTREREVPGPMVRILREARSVLHRTLERESREDQLFTTGQLLPREAVDECLVNAIAHRNYAILGQAVEVMIYPDRVEFRSPGRLPEPITVKDLEEQRGAHRSRNPVMMRVLRDLGWTRDQGEGMSRIFGSMRQVELHEPILSESADTFTVRLSTRSVYDMETQAWIASYGPFGLRPEERRYMVALRRAGGQLSVDKLARFLSENFDHVKKLLTSLEKRGLVWHKNRSRSYRVVEPLNVPHERVFRIFEAARIEPNSASVLSREQIAQAARSRDEQTTSTLIEQWKQAGILTPAGRKQWKLGPSFLAYLNHRCRPLRNDPEE